MNIEDYPKPFWVFLGVCVGALLTVVIFMFIHWSIAIASWAAGIRFLLVVGMIVIGLIGAAVASGIYDDMERRNKRKY
jgi:uncharacterized membrane protein YGL010W